MTDNTIDPVRCVAATLWGEARGQPITGIVAVACVIRNRAAKPAWWGTDVQSVCLAKKQFSCWWDQQRSRCETVTEADAWFRLCLSIAQLLDGLKEDPSNGADHYCRHDSSPRWKKGRTPVAWYGDHVFYRLGSDGKG